MPMRFVIDHDFHIHSFLSDCSRDPAQTSERILDYARQNGLRTICLTNHFWDEKIPGASDWYRPQGAEHIREALPLPQADGIRFLFGCETDMDRHMTLGISPETAEQMDFIVIPTTHLHMMGFTLLPEDDTIERRAELYVQRLSRLMDYELPFEKVGIAHLTCHLLAPRKDDYLRVLSLIPDSTLRELFTRVSKRGAGVELNFNSFAHEGEALEQELRIYRIAAACGCRFYLGSDAHHPAQLAGAVRNFEHIVTLLGLTEEQKFRIGEKKEYVKG